MKRIYLFLITLMSAYYAQAQGTIFYAKGGLTIATQKWNGVDGNQPLLAPTMALGLEFPSASTERKLRSSFGIQLGYHQKGNSTRIRYQSVSNPNEFERGRLKNQFHNVGLLLFGKGSGSIGTNIDAYYLLGLRLDYTYKFDMYMNNIDNYVKKFNYGVSIGGGFDYKVPNTRLGIFVEATISPDISRQVYVPAGIPVQYQINGVTNSYPSQEMKVYNLVFEVTLGFRILPKVYEEIEEDFDY